MPDAFNVRSTAKTHAEIVEHLGAVFICVVCFFYVGVIRCDNFLTNTSRYNSIN